MNPIVSLGRPAAGVIIDAAAQRALRVAILLEEDGWSKTTVTFEFNGTVVALDHEDAVSDVVRRYHDLRRLGVSES